MSFYYYKGRNSSNEVSDDFKKSLIGISAKSVLQTLAGKNFTAESQQIRPFFVYRILKGDLFLTEVYTVDE